MAKMEEYTPLIITLRMYRILVDLAQVFQNGR